MGTTQSVKKGDPQSAAHSAEEQEALAMSATITYPQDPDPKPLVLNERGIEDGFIAKLRDLKYTDRTDIHDRAALENNFYQLADEANKKITHLDDFAATFLLKCTLGTTISRYMVLIASEQKLIMMRPYQVYAVKHLVSCIHEDSGKTPPFIKAGTLLKDNRCIHRAKLRTN